MKKWLLVFPLVCAMAISTPIVIGGGEFLSAESKIYNLSQDLGSSENPVGYFYSNTYSSVLDLEGDTFDGKNHTVYLSTSGEKQGLFKTATNSTIKNVKIEWTVNFSDSNVYEFIAGGLVAEAKNTIIENCHVVLNLAGSADPNVGNVIRKLTFGGIVGSATGGCIIRNCSVELNCNFDVDYPTIDYSTYIGGIAGKIKDSKINLSFSSGSVTVNKVGNMDSNLYMGGITGSCDNGNIVNVVTNLKMSADKDFNSNNGGIAGYINGGGIKSVVYSTNVTENYGSQSDTEIFSRNIIALTDETYLQKREFYTQESQTVVVGGIQNVFAWDVFGDGVWDMDSTWNLTENKLQLQAFLKFEITRASSFANKDLFDNLIVNPNSGPYFYEEKVTLSFDWKDSKNSRYYQITQILRNGSPINFIEKGEGAEGNVVLEKTADGFSIIISAKETTEGEYSLYLEPISYHAYLAVAYVEESDTVVTDEINDHGSCVFEGGSITDREISINPDLASFGVRALTKTKNKFDRWELYYKTSMDSEDNIYYKGANWEKQDIDLGAISQISNMTFGEDWADQDFLLIAYFTDNYRSILFDFDNEHIEKITAGGEEILGSNGTLNIDGTNNTTIKIYVKEGFVVDKNGLMNAFNSILNGGKISEIQEINLDNRAIYSFVVNGSSINESGTNSVTVPTVEEEKELSINLGAVIGGSVAGGVVLIGLIIFLLWYFGVIGRGKYAVKSKEKMEKQKNSGDDYKKYFY